MTGLLVVTAVPAEAEAIQAGLADPTVAVVPVGVGPAVAGAATARLLALAEAAGRPYRGVVSAGVAGGFSGLVQVGDTVLGTCAVAADLGAESSDGFIPVDELGMPPELLGGGTAVDADPGLLAVLRAALPAAAVGPVLTVSTVTGTAASTEALRQRHPDAVAEAMEGYGV
ncbi:futalosine hydrolase, partial [Micromonospora sp. NPDC051296]|uniref:futalosine hydrolase n=1 Tax=Micromonospora sp. NPDC051296 TaxID=3155046 RepID=UPI00343A2058